MFCRGKNKYFIVNNIQRGEIPIIEWEYYRRMRKQRNYKIILYHARVDFFKKKSVRRATLCIKYGIVCVTQDILAC